MRLGSTRSRRWPVINRSSHHLRYGVVTAALCIGALTSCAVGPDFAPPPPPDVERFTTENTASPGGGQHFREGAYVPAKWWTSFIGASECADRRFTYLKIRHLRPPKLPSKSHSSTPMRLLAVSFRRLDSHRVPTIFSHQGTPQRQP